MRIVVDTNVIIRYLTWDNPDEANTAAALLESDEHLVLPVIVLCEVAWVLKRGHRYRAAEIYEALITLFETVTFETDADALASGLKMLKDGGDFADGCILGEVATSASLAVATFDKRFARLAGGRARLLRAS